MIILLALSTFLIGGILANLELDLKKIVAFSTIRQIRMIRLFLGLGFLSVSMFHMFNHALFKTLIFCSCGFFFVFNRGDQGSSFLGKRNFRASPVATLLFRIFIMTGFQFSSSFLTKDLILECLNDIGKQFFFLALIIGRIFTLFYCRFILNCSINSIIFLKKNFLGFKFYN